MSIVRMILLLVLAETALYLMVSAYIRSLRAEALEKEWARRHPDGHGGRQARDRFVRAGMFGFRKTLRARLVSLVFVFPTVAVLAIMWAVNS